MKNKEKKYSIMLECLNKIQNYKEHLEMPIGNYVYKKFIKKTAQKCFDDMELLDTH